MEHKFEEKNIQSKSERIKKEISRLKKQLKNMPESALNIALSLVKSAAFMTVTLEDLENSINKNGIIEEYQNGKNQWGKKKSPAVEVYNTMVKNHATIIKQLTDLVVEKIEQKPEEKPTADELDSLIASGKRRRGGVHG